MQITARKGMGKQAQASRAAVSSDFNEHFWGPGCMAQA